jgi:putative oxidoreductase
MKTNKTLDLTLLIVRIFLGSIIAAHGAQKLLGWFGGYGFEGTMGFFTDTVGLPYLIALLVILAESVGMVALAFGFLTRYISAGLIFIMAGAIVTSHGQHGFFMNWFGAQGGEGYEYHLLVIALSAVTLLNGAGAYSVDNAINKFIRSKTSEARVLA